MARTPTTTKTPLAARFGHEENLDRHIASQHLLRILSELGVTAIGSPEFQVTVPHGDDGKQGRIDIVQNTTSGAVIIENQYGTSDSYHYRKLSGYAKSIRNTFCVVWIAESFRAEHPEAAFRLPFPAWCVKAAPKGKGAVLEPLRPAAEALQPHADRIRLCEEVERKHQWRIKLGANRRARISAGAHKRDYAGRKLLHLTRVAQGKFRAFVLSDACEPMVKACAAYSLLGRGLIEESVVDAIDEEVVAFFRTHAHIHGLAETDGAYRNGVPTYASATIYAAFADAQGTTCAETKALLSA